MFQSARNVAELYAPRMLDKSRRMVERIFAGLMLVTLSGGLSAQVIYTYEDVPGVAITTNNNNCPGGPNTNSIVRTINVPDSFNVGAAGTIALGVVINHANRDHVQIRLQAPNGNTVVLADGVATDGNDNYNVTFGDPHDTTAPLNDGDNDPATVASGTVFYRRLVNFTNLSSTLYPVAGNVNGNWTLRICDDTATIAGTYVRARLTLRDNATTSISGLCGSTNTFDWGTVTTVPASVASTTPASLPDGTTITTGGVVFTQVQSVEAPVDAVNSFRRQSTVNGADTGYYALIMNLRGVGTAADDTENAVESVRWSVNPPVAGLDVQFLDTDFNSGAWEDYIQIRGFDESGAVVPYLSTFVSGTATLSRVGDWVEADGVNIDGTSSAGNVRIRFNGVVSSFTLGYAAGDEPATESNQQVIGLGDPQFCAYDFGDGPLSYGTAAASHSLRDRTRLYIGATPPDGEAAAGEPGGGPSAAATGDGADEGGIVFLPYEAAPLTMTCGSFVTAPGDYCVQVSATNNTTNPAQLVGFIDFNADGDFNDPGERSSANFGGGSGIAADGTWNTGNILASSGTQTYVLVWSGFAAPTTGASLARFRITTDATYFNNASPPSPGGALSNGEIEDQAITAGTLPVTLAFVEAKRIDANRLAVEWSSATEAGTMGYRILQARDGRMVALGAELTPSARLSTTVPQDYREVFLSNSDGAIYVEELSASGKTERFGPYQVGVASGGRPQMLQVPWDEVATERSLHAAADRQARIERGASRGLGAGADILVNDSGLQHINVSDLVTAGLNVVGRPVDDLRLSRAGVVVPVRVLGGGAIASNSILEFYGDAVSGSLYTKSRPYRLEIASGAAPWNAVSGAPEAGLAASWHRRVVTLDQNRYYDPTSPSDDPWYYDEVVRSGATTGKQWTLAAPAADSSAYAEVIVDLWGGSSYPELDPDHRYRVLFNGAPLGEGTFDGISVHEGRFPIPQGSLQAGNNTVRLELLATGQSIDRTYVNGIRISYLSRLEATSGRVSVKGSDVVAMEEGVFANDFELSPAPAPACGAGCNQLLVGGFDSNDVVALQLTDAGPVELTDGLFLQANGQWSLRVRPLAFGQGEDAVPFGGKMVFAQRSAAFHPAVRPALGLASPLVGGNAELMLISSPRFAGQVGALVSAREAEGLSVRVVDVEQIYEYYSNGIVEASAIKRFVADAYVQLGTRYVLLVGGDTYDYFNYLGLGSVSDVPTLYRRTHEFVSYAPIDSEFGDVDGDGQPEVAVGRLPARTDAELASLIAKTLQPLPVNPYSLVFAAERANQAEGIDYTVNSNELIAGLGNAWQPGADRVFLDSYPATQPGTLAARTDLMTMVNQGRNWVSFFGHASPGTWSRELLLQGSQLEGLLNNAGKAPLVTEFGCWGGYFVEPTYTTMNHAWLLTPDRGARAMIASSSLTDSGSDRAIANALIAELAVPGIRLGDALVNAKRTVWLTAPERKDVVLGMSLFGDPTSRLTPAN